MKRLLIALAILLFASVGANSAETSCAGSPCLTAVPTSATAVVSSNVRLSKAVFSNTTAGALTVTVSDQSTNCNSGVLPTFPKTSRTVVRN